jgi:hypothetical protein
MSSGATTIYVADWGDTGGNFAGGLNYFDMGNLGGTYFKIDNEIIQLSGNASNLAAAITSVDTGTSYAYSANHGLVDGQVVMLIGSPIDNGLAGNSLCRIDTTGQDNNCLFFVHRIDINNVQFFSNSGLTGAAIALTGGGASMYMLAESWAITPGALGTTQASHAKSASIAYYPLITPLGRVSAPDNHGFFYTTAIATALDHDLTVVDQGTGATITAQRTWDVINQTIYNQQMAGNNVLSCAGIGLTLANCDEPRWGIMPRPLIRNVRVLPGTTSAAFYYTAPDGNGCKVGVSATGFPSTDDSGDTADGKVVPGRSYTVGSLTTGTPYSYRITCGPSGAARVAGVFTTN